jgi:chaperone required for assembly of F1-ATPase
MRDIFEEIFEPPAGNPMEAARRAMRPVLRKRFYRDVTVGEAAGEGGQGGFPVQLDGRPVRTPARRPLAAPVRELAHALADEWAAQGEAVDPARMPLTRLANAIVDGVASAPEPVRAEIERYLASDLLFYRASGPEGLLAHQAQHWDPVLDWAREALGARFAIVAGVMHVAQPAGALAAAAAAVPKGTHGASDAWRLGALHVVTTLTGSALLALALAAGRLDAEAVWAAAHVDEDFNITQWGSDELALERRAFHHAELRAAATVLSLLRDR